MSKLTKKNKIVSPLKDMVSADGNNVELESPKYRTIGEMLGRAEYSIYKTGNASEYESYLSSLDTFDLQTHATECGVIPKSSRARTIDTLMELFIKDSKRKDLVPSTGVSPHQRNKDKQQNKDLLELLKRGR